MTDRPPALSVVMPVRDVAPWLDEAIASILASTYADFELVVVDDGSTDGSPAYARRWAKRDRRVKVHERTGPPGLVVSANDSVRLSSAPLVARMDGDDVAHPDRLRRQVEVLEGRPDVVGVGTLFEGIDAGGRVVRPRDRARLLRPGPFPPYPHGSATFRRSAFEAVGGYREGTEGWEDIDLARRLRSAGGVAVLTDVLYQYRYQATSTSAAARLDARADQLRRLHEAVDGVPISTAAARVEAFAATAALVVWSGARPGGAAWLLGGPFVAPPRRLAAAALYGIGGALTPRLLRRSLAAPVACPLRGHP